MKSARPLILFVVLELASQGAYALSCREIIGAVARPAVWAFRGGSDIGRRFDHPATGIRVEERVSWFGLVRRILVTYPDGRVLDFNRTDRDLQTLIDRDFYPASFFDPARQTGKRFVDYGCGGGAVVESLVRRGFRDAKGVEIYLDRRQRSLPDRYVHTDGERVNLPDVSADVVLSTWTAFQYLVHEARKESDEGRPQISRAKAAQVLGEMIRITAVGGSILISPAPHRQNGDKIVYPEIESMLAEYFPDVRIKSRPDAAWLARKHPVANVGKEGQHRMEDSEIWVELERTR